MLRKFSLVTFMLLVLLGSTLALAQTITTGDLTGTVTDSTGAVVPNATVTAKDLRNGETRTATSNNSGEYRITFLRPGEYTVSAGTTGLKSDIGRVTVGVSQAVS